MHKLPRPKVEAKSSQEGQLPRQQVCRNTGSSQAQLFKTSLHSLHIGPSVPSPLPRGPHGSHSAFPKLVFPSILASETSWGLWLSGYREDRYSNPENQDRMATPAESSKQREVLLGFWMHLNWARLILCLLNIYVSHKQAEKHLGRIGN